MIHAVGGVNVEHFTWKVAVKDSPLKVALVFTQVTVSSPVYDKPW